jgi:chromosome partitioning protein
MTRVISIANQKGGVGKTTTAINLAVALAMAGRRCLLVDADSQCNATSGLGIEPAGRHPWLSAAPLTDSIETLEPVGPEVLFGSQSLGDADSLSRLDSPRGAALREAFRHLFEQYEYVLVDCPPSLGQITRIALGISSEVLIPIQCEYFAMEGLSQLIELLRLMRQRDGREPEIGGIALTMFQPDLELANEVANEVRAHFGDRVFDSIVPRDVLVSEAPSHGQSVIQYAPRARGTRAYIELAWEVLGQAA